MYTCKLNGGACAVKLVPTKRMGMVRRGLVVTEAKRWRNFRHQNLVSCLGVLEVRPPVSLSLKLSGRF